METSVKDVAFKSTVAMDHVEFLPCVCEDSSVLFHTAKRREFEHSSDDDAWECVTCNAVVTRRDICGI